MQSDNETFKKLVEGMPTPEHQSLPIMGNESDPEILMSDFKTWPLVGVGRGYQSDFFKHTVIPMAMTTKELAKKSHSPAQKREDACQAASRINDIGWRTHVTNWIQHDFQE